LQAYSLREKGVEDWSKISFRESDCNEAFSNGLYHEQQEGSVFGFNGPRRRVANQKRRKPYEGTFIFKGDKDQTDRRCPPRFRKVWRSPARTCRHENMERSSSQSYQ
jgi:hypothetical protein